MIKTILFVFLSATTLLFIGCGTNVQYVQPGSPGVVSAGIDFQDLAGISDEAIGDLLASGAVDRVATPPALLYVSPILDNTSQQIQTDLLTDRITKRLHDSGKAQISSVDPAAKGYQEEKEFMNDQQTNRLPDFTLSGNIIESYDRSGNTARHTYTFQLSLNDTKTGLQVWKYNRDIAKQGTRGTVGF